MPEHRDGKKFRGNHTTYTDLSARVADILVKCDEVSGVSPGMIQCGKGMVGGSNKVKIGDMQGGVLLTVRQSRSVQELRVYTTDAQATKLALAKALRDADVPISFRH